ncbi:MAG: NAD-dependent epimerase/dehydratase family protein, partial [Eubacterium sp.]
VKNNQVIFSILSDREVFDNLPGGIVKAHHLPSAYEGTQTAEKINLLVKSTIEKLKISNGPVYFQIKVCNSNPYLIEVTPRLDGCHLWDFINRYCGVNLLELTMKHFLGEDIEITDYRASKCPMHLEFFCEPCDTVFNEDKYKSYVSDFSFMYYRTGDKVKRLNGYMEKCGYRIYKSPCKIGVVGGSGFVGRNFIKMYADEFQIIDISRQSGAVEAYSTEQLKRALSGCDSVVILAAKKVNADEKQSLSLYYDNISVTENTLEACRSLGISNIIFASSRCVYSANQPSPIAEDGLIEPINYYGISKSVCEQLCRYYNDKFHLKIKVLRLAQIIGNDKNGYMIDKFISCASKNEPLSIYGSSAGKRDYIYIKDVCRAIMLALGHYNCYGAYNIGSGRGTTSKELAEAVISGFNSNSELLFMPEKQEDTSVTYLDVSKAEKELGFSCEISLKEAFKDIKNFLK